MAKSHKETWLGVVVIAFGVAIAAAVGLFSLFNVISTRLYSDPKDVPSATHATPPQQWTEAVERGRTLARSIVVDGNLPGLSVAVGADDELVWAEGFGWADLEKRVAVTPATRFRIGHASKALTSAAVGLLLEKERLRLDDEIQTYVPAFPKKQWPVTLRQLMGHVAGIRHYRSEQDYMPTAHCARASEGLHSFASDPLLFEPQTQSRYSTFGWILVSAAVETASGQPFFEFMRTQIFGPLGMSDTTSDAGGTPMPNRATFYYPRFSGDTAFGPEWAKPVDYSCFAGAGGFLSTPSDLVRFALALDGEKLLHRATVRKLQTPQLLTSGEETDFGLGWVIERVPLAGGPTLVASHASRTLLGGSTSFMTFPEHGLVVAMTSNISYASTRHIALGIAEAFATRRRDRAGK
jgi:serine beta-lactamase-like protein LACTB, mitochondrial